MFVTENLSDSNVYEVQWYFLYKELKGSPVVNFDLDQIQVFLKVSRISVPSKRDDNQIFICFSEIKSAWKNKEIPST
jgi:hypothetical protein